MPGITRESGTREEHGPVTDIHEDVLGYTINIVSFAVDLDATPLLKGLPGDRCHCPHWGYVTKGQITFRFADHDESFAEGAAFYVPGGHAPIVTAGTEYVQFSPAEQLCEVTRVLVENTMKMMGAAG